MNKHLIFKLIALLASGYFYSAHAATLTTQMPNGNPTYTTTKDSVFDAKIYINDVADFAGFDFNLTYDSTKLSAVSLTSGNIFGADTDTFVNTFAAGSAHFAEALSFLSSATTGLKITAPTLLATFTFKAINTGDSQINILEPILSDFFGESLDGSLQGAFVSINPAVIAPAPVVVPPPAAVPLPAAIFLFTPCLLALFGFKKKNAQCVIC